MLKRRREQTDVLTQRKPLRLWPGVVIVALQWLVRFGVLIVMPEAVTIAVFGGLLGWLAIVVWWAFFSRTPRFERWSAVVLIAVALVMTWLLMHASMRLMPFVAYLLPVFSLAFVVGAAVSRGLSDRPRRAVMAATTVLACGVWTLVQTSGVTGDFHSDFTWRWAETPEERFLVQANDVPMALPSIAASAETDADWPGFRGPNRDGIIHGVQIETDWSVSPPVELWRRLVGPGWSSLAVLGDLLYTQEQHGEEEAVTCYNMTTGEPVWKHQDAVRFWESNAGAGPRGTPTISNGRVYTLGATGILNVLGARDGSVLWSRDVASDTNTKLPMSVDHKWVGG